MEKTIKINSKTSLKVSNNIGWMLAYRDQFGRDIVPTLIPALTAALEIAVEVNKAAQAEGVATMDVLKVLDSDALRDALIEISGIEMVDIIHIIWAMAKAADDDIEEPGEWVKQFDQFPLDTILPVIFDMVVSCMVSSKNSKRFQTMMQSLKPSPSTES